MKTKKIQRNTDARRALPSVSKVLEAPELKPLRAAYPLVRVTEAIQCILTEHRASSSAAPSIPHIAMEAAEWLEREEFQRLRPVVNATGVILHTNLGRAVLPASAAQALALLDRACSLHIDLETGARGKRHFMTEHLLCRLTGAEAALVVNNNAAATLLALTALCAGREVIVSRGQLIEIGGSFRLPDCIHQSGAVMVEVGTTNKTHLRDYEQAITERTAALLRVNPSNYRIIGFTKEVATAELVSLKAKHPGLIVIDDLGCGALLDLTGYGLPHEPTVPESIRAGADLTLFSGDKLIGGPQAGILAGRADLIDRIKKHPLTRMLRVDKMTDLALEQTLRLFLDPERLHETNPTWRMLTMPLDTLRRRGETIVSETASQAPSVRLRVVDSESTMGGGTLPGHPIPSVAVSLRPSGTGASAEEWLHQLRRYHTPVIAHIVDGAVLLDLRTLLDGEEQIVVSAIKAASDVFARKGAAS